MTKRLPAVSLLISLILTACTAQLPTVGVVSTGLETQSAEVSGLSKTLKSVANVKIIDIASPSQMASCDVVWYHSNDTVALQQESAFAEAAKEYVAAGGKLVLSMEAVKLLNSCGIEPQSIETWTYDCEDWGFGRKFGFHGYRSHPIYDGMFGGAYPWHGHENNVARVNGFTGKNLPKAEGAKVIGTQWEYIFSRPELKTVWETPYGKGSILAIGNALYYDKPNFYKQQLDRLTTNVAGYMAGTLESDQKARCWNYEPAKVVPFNEEHPDCKVCAALYKPVHAYPYPWEFHTHDGAELPVLSREATGNYLVVASSPTMVVGGEKGGIDEIWSHPIMSLRDYKVWVGVGDYKKLTCLNSLTPVVDIYPFMAVRHYDLGQGVKLDETIVADPEKHIVNVHYDWTGGFIPKFIVEFKSNLRYMWPYDADALGSLYYGWSPELNAFVVRDHNREFSSIIGSNVPGQCLAQGQFDRFTFDNLRLQSYPTDLLQASAVVSYDLKGFGGLDMVFATSVEDEESTLFDYADAVKNPSAIADRAYEHYKEISDDCLAVVSPDPEFNEALLWAQISAQQFPVNTPGIGTALMAGYSSSRRGWGGGHRVSGRPGYAWYFGRDAAWSGFAFDDMGDFETVRQTLETLMKFQQIDGKIYHELTSSGFVHFDASDATPLFVCLMGHYLRASGDVEFAREHLDNIRKALEFMHSTDTDGDGLIENDHVGHGWLEGGYLFGAQAEFYLGGCWKKALEDAAYIFDACGKGGEAKKCADYAEKVVGVELEKFWNEEKGYYNYALDNDDTYRTEFVSLTMVPVLLGTVDEQRGRENMDKLIAPNFSVDWGIRQIAEDSELGEICRNEGAYAPRHIWPLFSGWSVLAQYETGLYNQAFSTLKGSLMNYREQSLGHISEVISGDSYSSGGITHHQCWSEALTISDVVRGMLGFKPDAVNGTTELAPHIPADWGELIVKNLKQGDDRIAFRYLASTDRIEYDFVTEGTMNLVFKPTLAAHTKISKVTLDGKPVKFSVKDSNESLELSTSFKAEGKQVLVIECKPGADVAPAFVMPVLDQPSSGLRILSQSFEGDELRIKVSGRPGAEHQIKVNIGGIVYPVEVKLPEGDALYTVTEVVVRTAQLKNSPVEFSDVKVEDSFWAPRIAKHAEVTVPFCLDQCTTQTSRLDNFAVAGGLKEGRFKGLFYDDSDLYKSLEGAAYSLQNTPDPALEATLDSIATIIGSAQWEDGYINTWFTLAKPGERWTDMDKHEMYCGGHLIEAAIAYYNATGKTNYLDIAIRFADHLVAKWLPADNHWVAGHPEIELALVKLYRLTGNSSYLALCHSIIEDRGHGYAAWDPKWLDWYRDYYIDAMPVGELSKIQGHAVRNMYLFTGMADYSAQTGSPEYLPALDRLWDNVVGAKMYITGGIGSSASNEGFLGDYELPNKDAYCETCASVGMVFWNQRMNMLYGQGRYVDVLERSMYNGALAGVSLSNDRFFYVNPLESDGTHHRRPWYGTACCPSQISRFLPSIGGYVYATGSDALWINLFVGSSTEVAVGGVPVKVSQKTDYPWDGNIEIKVSSKRPAEFAVKVRIPDWCKEYGLAVNGRAVNCAVVDGYATISRKWGSNDRISVNFEMPVEVVAADPRVKDDIGRRAIQRGPIVYCMEGVDNPDYESALITPQTRFETEFEKDLLGGVVTVTATTADKTFKFVPYYSWDNREAGPMQVWVKYEE